MPLILCIGFHARTRLCRLRQKVCRQQGKTWPNSCFIQSKFLIIWVQVLIVLQCLKIVTRPCLSALHSSSGGVGLCWMSFTVFLSSSRSNTVSLRYCCWWLVKLCHSSTCAACLVVLVLSHHALTLSLYWPTVPCTVLHHSYCLDMLAYFHTAFAHKDFRATFAGGSCHTLNLQHDWPTVPWVSLRVRTSRVGKWSGW